MSASALSRSENRSAEKPQLYKPGQSGNPGGRPKQVLELIELARTAVPQAFALAMKLMVNGEEDSRVRLEAAKFLTSYGLGAPPKQIQLTGADGGQLMIDIRNLTDEQLEARYQAIKGEILAEAASK